EDGVLLKGQDSESVFIVLTVAGGSPAEILAQSDLKSVREQRELRFNELGLGNLNDYQARLSSAISYDPMKWASHR
ncbi:MAG: hypothetical protein ACK5UJ_02115, partial [Pseudobdellovibrionaceae bacterium]